MCNEICSTSADFDNFDRYCQSSIAQPASSASPLHQVVLSLPNKSYSYKRVIQFGNLQSEMEHKTRKIATVNKIAPMGSVNGEVGATITWGGENGTEVSGYVSGSAFDDKGNKAEVTIEVNSDGSGSATVSASHSEDSNS